MSKSRIKAPVVVGDYAGAGFFAYDWQHPPPLFNSDFDPKAAQRFSDGTAGLEQDNFYAIHTREECKEEWRKRYEVLRS